MRICGKILVQRGTNPHLHAYRVDAFPMLGWWNRDSLTYTNIEVQSDLDICRPISLENDHYKVYIIIIWCKKVSRDRRVER